MTVKLLTLARALDALRVPGAKLVHMHERNGAAYYVWPNGGRITDSIAELLLQRADVQPFDSGLFPGHPQSWRLGNWREWGGQ